MGHGDQRWIASWTHAMLARHVDQMHPVVGVVCGSPGPSGGVGNCIMSSILLIVSSLPVVLRCMQSNELCHE